MCLAKFKSEVEREEAISKLCDCEKYMCEMMKVKNASKKLTTLMYFALFNDRFLELEGEIKSLKEACECVRSSDKLRRLMVFALRLGNTLNTDGSNAAVSAITMDSLLKMHEAKAFDKRTSVLHYLVSIIEKNDSAVLSVKDQLESFPNPPAQAHHPYITLGNSSTLFTMVQSVLFNFDTRRNARVPPSHRRRCLL